MQLLLMIFAFLLGLVGVNFDHYSQAAGIGPSIMVPSLTVGGRTFTDLSNLIYLHGRVATAARWATFRTENASAGRQTTSGKTLTIYACNIYSETASTTTGMVLLYGDTDVGMDAAAAPTNPVYLAGDSSLLAGGVLYGAATTGVMNHSESAVAFQVPSLKYPAMKYDSTAAQGTCYAYEQ